MSEHVQGVNDFNADGGIYIWNSNDIGPVDCAGQGLGTTTTDWRILSAFHGM